MIPLGQIDTTQPAELRPRSNNENLQKTIVDDIIIFVLGGFLFSLIFLLSDIIRPKNITFSAQAQTNFT